MHLADHIEYGAFGIYTDCAGPSDPLAKREIPAFWHPGAARLAGVEPVKPLDRKAHRLTLLCFQKTYKLGAGHGRFERLNASGGRRRRSLGKRHPSGSAYERGKPSVLDDPIHVTFLPRHATMLMNEPVSDCPTTTSKGTAAP